MIRICSKCGALLLDDTGTCSFCEVPAPENSEILEPVAAGAIVLSETEEPEWRLEVSRRLEQYRARRGRLRPDDSQSGLPFQPAPVITHEIQIEEEEPREPRRSRPAVRPTIRMRHAEHMEICIQPELDFASVGSDRARPQTALVPVASLADRAWAGGLDGLFLALTCGGFAALFRSLGGQIALEKMDAIVYLAVAYLFYALYFFIFTTFAGATPGMQLRGLTIVRLDGSLPETRQLLWRNFGYLLAGATLMLGFLWALWDEDRFSWQDRISQTYITAAAPLSDFDAPDRMDMQSNRRLAHK